MKLKENNIELKVEAGEIKSIKYQDLEILHQGEKWWNKTYPMIWPVIGFSTGFEVDGHNYQLPKHGFWKELDWKNMVENGSITQVATYHANQKFPYTIDIQNNINIVDDEIIIRTIFTNLSKQDAFFHFGHHPAFKINHDTKLISNNKYQKILLDGKLKKEFVKLENLSEMKFGVDYDTLVAKDVSVIDETIAYQGLNINVYSKDFDGVQIWKPTDAEFVCIEPWQGWGDKEYNAPKKVQDKLGIIKLPYGISEEFEISIKISKEK